MASNKLSQGISDLYKQVHDLRMRSVSDPGKAAEILSDALEELQIRLEELLSTDEELQKTNRELEQHIDERNVELQSAHHSLKDRSQYLDAFFEHSITPMVFLDRDFNFIRVNEAYAKACQKEISDFPGHNHFEFYPSDAKAIFEEVVSTKMPFKVIARPFKFPDHPEWGVTYWDWMLTPLLDDKGEVEYLVFSLDDVTGRKRAEIELEKHRENLEEVVSKRTCELETANNQLQKEITEHKRSEEALHQSQSMLAQAEQIANLGSWKWDIVSGELIWSEQTYRIFGEDPKQFVPTYESFLAHIHPDYRPHMEQTIKDSLFGKKICDIEYPIITSNPITHWAHSRGEVVFDEDGQPISMIGTVSDITERKHTEEELLRQQEELALKNSQLHAMFEHSNAGLVLFDAQPPYRVLAVNRYYQDLWPEPYRSQGLIGKALTEYAPNIEESGIGEVFREVVNTKKGKVILNFPYDGMVGGRRWWNWTLEPIIHDSQVLALAHLAIDVTQEVIALRRAEDAAEAARQSEELYHEIFEKDLTGDFIATTDGQILVCNPAFVKIFGFSSCEEAIVSNLAELYPHPDIYANVIKLIKEHKVLNRYECDHRRHDGAVIHVVENIVGTFDEHGELIQLKGYVFDDTERKLAEEELKEGRDKLRALFDLLPVGVSITDKNREVIESNPALEKILGIPKEGLLKGLHGTRKYLKPDGSEMLPEEFPSSRALKEEGVVQNAEFSIIKEDGTKIWTDVKALSLPFSDWRVVVITSDITEGKLAEEHRQRLAHELANRASELHAVLDTAPIAIWIAHDPQCRKITGNDYADKILRSPQGGNISLSALPGDAVISYKMFRNGIELHPEELPAQIAAATGKPVDSAEFDLVFPDGRHTYLLMSAMPLFDARGHVRGSVTTGTDVTQIKLAEEELQKAKDELELRVQERTADLKMAYTVLEQKEAEYRQLAELSPDAIIVYRDGQIVFSNNAAVNLLGASSAGDLIGKQVVDFIHPDFRDLIGSREKALSEGKYMNPPMEQKIMGLNGRITETEAASTSVVYGGLPAILVVARDIAVRKAAEEELKRAKDAAETAVQAKATFLANMSHELRTPMNAIIGFTGLLLEEPLAPDQRDYLERVRNSGNVLLALINDILEFSRAERQKIRLEQHSFSLRRCIEESLDLVSVHAMDKGLDLAFTLSYGIPDTIVGDQGRLRQILVNLLSNAVKFTDRGKVAVSVSSRPLDQNRYRILFQVEDTGIGIPPDKMDLLFQPFSQVDTTTSSKYGGTGLGLAISKSLVELMGGKIWAQSVPGEGSTFSFTIEAEVAQDLPLDLMKTGKAVTFDSMAKGQHPLRILIAEDNPSNQKVLQLMLERMGYRPDAVGDGKEVIQSIERQPYDLIFMDVKMPEMDGIEATREIRKRWPENGPKIVAITAYALEGDRERCLEVGMDDYIAKPVQKGMLAEILKGYAMEAQ